MNSAERKREILKILSQKESVGVEELAELFGVSRVTVRSDLDSLGSKGLLVRTHGGALSSENRNLIRMFSDTIAEKAEEKSRIAQAAAAFLHDGDTVIIDNGSTVMHVAEYLKDRNITVITGSLLAINELMKEESVELIILSGILRRYSMGAIGPLTCSTLGEIHADILFLGASAISEDGVWSSNLVEADTKKCMIRNFFFVNSCYINIRIIVIFKMGIVAIKCFLRLCGRFPLICPYKRPWSVFYREAITIYIFNVVKSYAETTDTCK